MADTLGTCLLGCAGSFIGPRDVSGAADDEGREVRMGRERRERRVARVLIVASIMPVKIDRWGVDGEDYDSCNEMR